MSTNGFTENTVKLCEKFDSSFLELLKDVYVYLYGKNYEGGTIITVPFTEINVVDRENLENCLRTSCTLNSDKWVLLFLGKPPHFSQISL